MIATESDVYNEGELTSGVDIHLTPVKSKERKSDGSCTTNRAQGRYRVCKVESTNMCSECAKDTSSGYKVPFICHTTVECVGRHMQRLCTRSGAVDNRSGHLLVRLEPITSAQFVSRASEIVLD
jgi:hypothetical protein